MQEVVEIEVWKKLKKLYPNAHADECLILGVKDMIPSLVLDNHWNFPEEISW